MIVEGGKVIDNETGEVIESDSGYVSIEEAEAALFSVIGAEQDVKLLQVKILLQISERHLYKQKLDDEGRTFGSMQAYLKSLEPQLSAIGAGKLRSLLSWMTRWKIFVEQLDKPERFLRLMGAHSDLLVPAAARHDATSQLIDVDDPLEGGGQRLGRERFTELTNFIEGKVTASKSGIPEQTWTVRDTRGAVREWMEKPEEPKAKLTLYCTWVNGDVRIDRAVWWVGDAYLYEINAKSALIPLEHFRLIAKSTQVEGLGEDWKG